MTNKYFHIINGDLYFAKTREPSTCAGCAFRDVVCLFVDAPCHPKVRADHRSVAFIKILPFWVVVLLWSLLPWVVFFFGGTK